LYLAEQTEDSIGAFISNQGNCSDVARENPKDQQYTHLFNNNGTAPLIPEPIRETKG
jgi:hypothetical protein